MNIYAGVIKNPQKMITRNSKLRIIYYNTFWKKIRNPEVSLSGKKKGKRSQPSLMFNTRVETAFIQWKTFTINTQLYSSEAYR